MINDLVLKDIRDFETTEMQFWKEKKFKRKVSSWLK